VGHLVFMELGDDGFHELDQGTLLGSGDSFEDM
jgi:hypothetical protein